MRQVVTFVLHLEEFEQSFEQKMLHSVLLLPVNVSCIRKCGILNHCNYGFYAEF